MKLNESHFYATAEGVVLPCGQEQTGRLTLAGRQSPASIRTTTSTSTRTGQPYCLVVAKLPEEPAWNQRLSFRRTRGDKEIQLRVVCPGADRLQKTKEEKLIAWLDRLAGPAGEMLLALADQAGIRGLRQDDLVNFCRMTPAELRRLSMELEREGQVYILEFSPLFLLSQRSFSFLVDKIAGYVESYHQKRPAESGVPLKKIKERFGLSRPVLLLALNRLAKDGRLVLSGDLVHLSSFQTRLAAEEKAVMEAIEQLLHQEKFSSSSFEELVKKFKIHPSRLNTLLDLLLKQKRIVKSQEGFLLHADWLENLKKQLAELKNRGQRELSVGDFKRLTGLTRKYAIPLLEFLDELGLTRRLGNRRLII
ncbi:MAG: SelB C-terminal domain-containing protein [Candidatus Saccharicenans sp.]|jgi:selenocysteine-specific elongation factor|nr:SelB C-terminal domain-containing protein [Candidatus Saccharicenans sp.]MDH7493349.1 SelB C-terminal domain-containing protein [Candidatus Saccharicenans sp.]